MIRVRVEVRNETGSFTVAVYAENLRRATHIAKERYPGCAIGIPFPIDPDGFFVAGPRHDGLVGLEGAGEAGGSRKDHQS